MLTFCLNLFSSCLEINFENVIKVFIRNHQFKLLRRLDTKYCFLPEPYTLILKYRFLPILFQNLAAITDQVLKYHIPFYSSAFKHINRQFLRIIRLHQN